MLSNKFFAILLVAVAFCLPSILYLVSPGFLGYDSYYFLTEVCGGNQIYNAPTNAPLHDMLLPYLPCNDFLLKAVLVALFGVALLTIYAITRLRYKEHAHMGIVFALVSPVLLYNSFKFENDAFAFPIMFVALYFFLKYLDSNKQKKIFLATSIGFLFISSLFWAGSLYYLIIFSFFEPLLLFITIPMLIVFFGDLLGGILPNFAVNENNPLQGVIAFLFFQVFWLVPQTRKVFDFDYKKLTIVLVGVGLLNPKFMVLAVPMISLTITRAYSMVGEKKKRMMLLMATIMLLGFSLPIGLGSLHPNSMEHEAVQELLVFSEDFNKHYSNDWSYGHMVYFYGGKTNQHSAPGNALTLESNIDNRLVLSRLPFDCPIVKAYEKDVVEGSLTLYNC